MWYVRTLWTEKYWAWHCCQGQRQSATFVPENNEQRFKVTVSNSAQESIFCKRSGNRQCIKGHNGDGLADFVPITTNSWFIMATSRYNYAIVNQNCVGIGPKSTISVRLCSMYHGGSSDRLLKWAIGTELETVNWKRCPMFMITVPLLERRCYFTSLQTNTLALLPVQKHV